MNEIATTSSLATSSPAGLPSSSPFPAQSSFDEQLRLLKSEMDRVTQLKKEQEETQRRETEARINQIIDGLPAQLGVPTHTEVLSLIRSRITRVGRTNNRKVGPQHTDDINRAIAAGASYKEIKADYKISSAAYYNRKRKLGLTRPVTPLAKRKAAPRRAMNPQPPVALAS